MPTKKKIAHQKLPMKKIVIIEDEAALLELYATRFRQEGYEVVTAGTGSEGYDLICATTPDLILLDIILPRIDGYQVLQQLKDTATTRAIPVIIFSNLSQREEIEKGLRLGAQDFIVKTKVTPTELAEHVAKFFGSPVVA